jgi:hypothetical protein
MSLSYQYNDRSLVRLSNNYYEETGTIKSRLFFVGLSFILMTLFAPVFQTVREFTIVWCITLMGVTLTLFLIFHIVDVAVYFGKLFLHLVRS